jgi:hypothetical protein
VSGGGLLALLMGCAIDPPSLPDGTPTGGSTTTTDAPDPAHADESGNGAGGTSSSSDPVSGSSESADPGQISTADYSGSSSGDDAGSTGAPTGVAVGSTGSPPPWYAGAYGGTWSGDCDLGPYSISGDGTWSVDIDEDGDITGSYDGDFSGNIVGWVDESGSTQATVTGQELDDCDWTGTVRMNGEASGVIDCPSDCSGEWST